MSVLLSHEAYLDNQTLFSLTYPAFFRMSGSERLRVLRLILTVKRVKLGFTIENTRSQKAPFKNFQTLDIDLKWLCLIPPDQFQFCFQLKRIVRNSGISECLLRISGAEPNPASNPGYAAIHRWSFNNVLHSSKTTAFCSKRSSTNSTGTSR